MVILITYLLLPDWWPDKRCVAMLRNRNRPITRPSFTNFEEFSLATEFVAGGKPSIADSLLYAPIRIVAMLYTTSASVSFESRIIVALFSFFLSLSLSFFFVPLKSIHISSIFVPLEPSPLNPPPVNLIGTESYGSMLEEKKKVSSKFRFYFRSCVSCL